MFSKVPLVAFKRENMLLSTRKLSLVNLPGLSSHHWGGNQGFEYVYVYVYVYLLHRQRKDSTYRRSRTICDW